MKLTFQQDDAKDEQTADGRTIQAAPAKGRGGLSRARKQLSQAVGGVLVNSLGALSSLRPQSRTGSTPPGAPSAQHGLRLREVIERDRALAASQALPSEVRAPQPAAAGSTLGYGATTVDDERFEEQDLDLETAEIQVPFRGREVLAPRSDAIALAIAEAIAETQIDDVDDDDVELVIEPPSQPIQLEPLIAAASKPVTIKSGPAPKQPVVCKEPIRTRTMAKLLASQGHRARALSIYDFLIAKSPHDEALVAEADLIRNQQD